LIAGAGVCLIAALVWIYMPSSSVRTEDAYVDGNIVQVTSQISGTVTAIGADDTDHVQAGHSLIQLNSVDQEVQFERAKAQLAKATRAARTQYSQVSQLQAQVAQRSNDVDKAKADLTRRAQLATSGAVSREEINHAEDALKNAQAMLTAARQQLAQRTAMVDGTVLRTHPEVLAAAANLRDAYVALERTKILAPIDGAVTKRNVQVGQRINPGASLMSVVSLKNLWVNANFKESQLESLRIGQPVTLTADVYGKDVTYTGQIAGLDAGTGSAFALLPAQNATGNWIKVTQRVPVRIILDEKQIAEHPLRLGLSMHVSVDASNQSGSVMSSGISPANLYTTHVFDHELHDASEIVEAVIKANEGVSNPVKADR